MFGERQDPEKYIPFCIKQLLNDQPITIHGKVIQGGLNVFGSRHYIHAKHVAEAIMYISQYGTAGEKYNIPGQERLNNYGKVKGIKGELYALEINPEKAGDEISKVIGKPMDSSDFSDLTNIPGLSEIQGLGQDMQSMPQPGMDEALSFAKILEYADDDSYDTIILDTAPTGHTLRLLNIPEFLDSFLGRMLKMRSFLSNAMTMMKSLFGAKGEKDNTIENLEIMKEKVLIARDLLMDEERTQFVKVMIPTMMSIFETERLVEELDSHSIAHKFVVVNMINPDNPNCQYCSHRRMEHMENIKYIESVFGKDNLTSVDAFDREIRGIKMLKFFADNLL